MTNLSKDLCKICGIERKGKLIFKKRNWDKKTYICAGRGYKEFDFRSIPEVTVDIVPTKDYEETNGFQYPYTDIEKIKKIYNEHGYDFVEFRQNVIDFTSPENFVRLLELKILAGATLWGWLSVQGVFMSQRKTVLKTIYLILSREINFCNKLTLEQIKQSIRETEWVYE